MAGDVVGDGYVDVWSYGVCVWEIMTGGCVPYTPDITNANSFELYNQLMNGRRLPPPPSPPCPEEVYAQLLLSCWQAVPADRPSFGEHRIEAAQQSGFSKTVFYHKT
ncbi:unnamed protein product [Sphagnum balticum]